MSEPILILGSGALACFFAAHLIAAGTRVKMLTAWEEAVSAIRRRGILIRDHHQVERAFPVDIFTDTDEIGESKTALVLVKSWQTEKAAKQLQYCLLPDGIALTLQNGLGNREILAAELGDVRVSAGTAVVGAAIVEPGVVAASCSKEIALENSSRLGVIQAVLARAGFRVTTAGDIESLLWGKLVANAAINPLSMLLEVKNGELLSTPSARLLINAIAHEVYDVALRLGHSMPYENPGAYVMAVIAKTADNRSSMLQDFLRRAPTEIDAMTGQVIRYARMVDVELPCNQVIYNLVKAKLHLHGMPLSPD